MNKAAIAFYAALILLILWVILSPNESHSIDGRHLGIIVMLAALAVYAETSEGEE